MIKFTTLHLNDELLISAQSLCRIGVWEYDPHSGTMLWSQQTYQIFGLNPFQEHKNAIELSDLVHQCFAAELQRNLDKAIDNCIKKGTPIRLEGSLINLSSQELFVRIVGQASGETLETRKILGTIQDLTEEKKLELDQEKLREKQQQTRRLDAIGRLAGGLAHDFNNIFTVIMGYAEELTENTDEHDPFRFNLAEITKACQKANSLVRQLLTFSSRHGGEKQVFDLNHWLEDRQKLLESLLGEKVELHYLAGETIGKIKAEQSQLEQVLLNLCINAREAMPEGGKLTLQTYSVAPGDSFFEAYPDLIKNNYVALEVTDTGIGMSENVLEHLFEPFFTTKQKTPGAGLGLAAAYGIMQQQGGYIRVKSAPDLGTTFLLLFPPTMESPAESELRALSDQDCFGKSILVVEDDEAIRDMICKILSRQNYRVSTANDGNEAVIMIKQGGVKYDLVLSDVVMPGLNGIDLAGMLPRLLPGAGIILMSGFNERVIAQYGKLDPKIPFMQKPFRKGDLEAKIRQVLQE